MAQVTSPFLKNSGGSRQGFEYRVGQDLGNPLITVKLLSGVREPGVYHLPMNSDLSDLVAYAGGANENADTHGIQIRHGLNEVDGPVVYDLQKSLEKKDPIMTMHDQDTVYIPTRNTFDGTIKWVGLVATVVSILASAALIDSLQRGK